MANVNGGKQMGLQVYMNGHWVSKEDAKVSIWDHGFLYGDGVFEGIRVYNGRVFKLDQHIKRLYESAKGIELTIPLSKTKMKEDLVETVRRNGMSEAYVRLIVSRGPGDLGLDPRKCRKATVVILADKISVYPEETYRKGLRVMIASTRRNPPDSINGRIKSLNYLNNIFAKLEHINTGVDEALLLNHDGYLVEGTAENIFIVKGEKFLTPPAYLGALEGVTRATVEELADDLGMVYEEALLTPHDLYVADECFLTGTGAEIVPVIEVDGRMIGDGVPGPATVRLLKAYRELTRNEGVLVFPKEQSPKPKVGTISS